ncbi:MAG TPA: S9 family peptidase [Candidatus Acidoferrales bacterium]|nr:S9 family peptidase [Candidatus Acidoferrales bacterium]
MPTTQHRPLRPMAILACFVAIFFAGVCSIQAQQKTFQVSDTEKLVSVSDPQISPNDKSIAVVVGRINMKDDGTDTEIVLVDMATGAQRVMTSGHKHASSPRWSPNGDRLAFVAAAGEGKDAAPQVFVLRMDGGDARKITDAPDGIEQFAWRPDGAMIAYVTPDPVDKKAIEAHHDSFEVGDTDFLETAAAQSSHVWLVSSDGGEAKRVTSGKWSLPIVFPPSPPSSPLSWTPDGKSLLITKQETAEPGDGDQTTLQMLDVDTGKTRKLTSHEKLESAGVLSPDGSQVAYWYNKDGDANNQVEIFVSPTNGGEGTDVTRSIDRDIQRAIWMPDGKSLLVSGHDGTGTSMWRVSLDGQSKKLNLGDLEPSWSFWVDAIVGPKGDVAFAGSSAGHPTELYYMDSTDAEPRKLTNYNDWISSYGLAKVTPMEWQGPNGFHEDGILDYPPGFSSGNKYPLVLLIHGGPQASSTIGFDVLGQLIAAQGYLVFQPNYRGSDNLGNAYQRAIYRDAGDGPGRDVMAGVTAVEKMGVVDTDKIGVSGWSYGGYMTSWMIGHYHIWKAAVSGAAVNDLAAEAALSDGNRTDYASMGGSPWVGDNWKIYRDESPITYAAQIKTPTLILCDVGDFRVPITQSFQMYHALKDNGVTTQFFAYPVAGHFPGDPVHREDVMTRWIGWLNQYLK